jgi:ATP-dependent helicase/nuclease subunit B
MIDATPTAYGLPAIDLLASQIAGLKDGDPLSPVTVVVRSNFVSVSTRRALAARPGGIANVAFVTLRRLAEQLGAAGLVDTGRRPVSAPLTTAAIRAVLAEAPGIFSPVADHPATEQALTSAHRELRTVPDAALDAVAACSTRASDVIRIHRVARLQLSTNWYDEEDLLMAAASVVMSSDALSAGPVVVHLLTSFTSGEEALVSALASRGRLVVNVGFTGDAEADTPVIAAHERAGIEVTVANEVEIPIANEIVSASDPDDEVRATVRIIAGWMHEGVRLGRIAILYPTTDPYARLLQEQLGAAGIPVNGTPVQNVGDMMFGRSLRTLLSLADRDFRRQDVLGLLSNAPILDQNTFVPSRAWERISRSAGIVHGRDWDDRLAQWAVGQRRDADDDEADGLEWRAAHRRSEADRADSLGAFVAELRSHLENSAQPQSWAANVNWLKGITEKYLGSDRLRAGWPEDEQEAAHRVEEALERLAGLDALGGPPPSIDIFRRTLDSELAVALRRMGRAGDGVLVGHVSIAAGMVFERLTVLGMSEGRFPPRRLEDSLLPDAERQAANGRLPLRAHRVHDDRRDLLAAIAGADHAVLSQSRGDLRRSTDQPASRWLLADAARLAGVGAIESSDLAHHTHEQWLTYIASFSHGLAYTPVYATDQDLRLATIALHSVDHPLLLDDARVRAALGVVRARRSSQFTRFDGNLDNVAAEIGPPDRISTTRLEAWAKCPRSYLFAHVLRVERVEEPERRFEIDPLTRGSLVHKILEEFVCVAIAEGHPLGGWSAADRDRLHEIAASHFDRAEQEGQTGRAILWRAERARIGAELDKLLVHDSQRLADGLRPVAAEREFDDVEIRLPSGHVMHMRGSIDRIDQESDGSLAVVDYKTGSIGAYRDLSEDNPHHGGRRLQLYVYGRAARDLYPDAPTVRADYWFTKEDKCHGYPITERVEHAVLGAMESIASGIASGVFPAHPSDQPVWGWVDCWFCTPDGLSDQHVRRDWERKRDDPVLNGYVALIESGERDDGT